MALDLPEGVSIDGVINPDFENVLHQGGSCLRRRPAAPLRVPRREELLAARAERQQRLDAGEMPDFLPETAHIRAERLDRGARCRGDLLDRRVEITGPVDRKMVINALNCGANVFMADFEDSNSPTWNNMVDGPDQPARRRAPGRSAFTQRGRQGLQAERRRPPCCWCARAAGTWTRST